MRIKIPKLNCTPLSNWCFSVAATFLGASALLAQNPIPKLINYQGRLTDAAGRPLVDGTYRVRFELFDTKTAPTNLVWGGIYDVSVIAGQFNVILGGVTVSNVPGAAVNDLRFALGSPDRYLQTTIEVGPGISAAQTLAPRQQLLSVPFAVQSQNAYDAVNAVNANVASSVIDGAITTPKLALNAVTTSNISPGAVTSDQIQTNAVNSWHIGTGAVGTQKLAQGIFRKAVYTWSNTGSITPSFNTGQSTIDWYPLLSGFSFGSGDIDENDSGTLGGVWFSESGGTWRITAGIRTHNNYPDPTVTVLWIPRWLVQ